MTPWQTILAIDFDKWAAATYAANFPDTEVRCASVADELDRLPYADVICAGPPCQPHSHAGKRLASKDARDCGPDFVEAVRRKQPRMFLMENVPGLLTSEGGKYAQRLRKALEDAGYVVEVKVQDAVQFGVPQFRNRCWWWGIRADLHRDGIRHCWPVPTHQWPPPEPGLFGSGANLLPGVTVGQALGLTGEINRNVGRGAGMIERHGDRGTTPTTEPSPTLGNGENGSSRMFVQSHADPAQPIDKPGPTLRSGGAGHDGCCIQLRLEGHGNFAGRDFDPNEPSPTIRGGTLPGGGDMHIYRWSDAMLEKHPPASPAPTVQAKWFKGGAEGLLDVTGMMPDAVDAKWKRKGNVWVRRLTPLECLRLQSGPDDFRWPDGISKTAMYRVIGNGWACGHAAAFSRSLAAADPDSRTVLDLFAGGGLGAVGFHQRYWVYQGTSAKAGVA